MEMDNDFWRYSLALYQQAGVENICLQLQDDYGLDVNWLLFCHWLASRGLSISEEGLGELGKKTDSWRNQFVSPLRNLRREIGAVEGVDAVREQIKSAELEAEKYQQALMWQYYVANQRMFVETELPWYEPLLARSKASQLKTDELKNRIQGITLIKT